MKIAAVTIAPSRDTDLDDIYDNVSDIIDEHVVYYPHTPIANFAEVRNNAFALAAGKGHNWGIMLDTDMQYHGNRETVPDQLERTHADIINLYDVGMTYAAPRIFRLPLKGQFVGLTHEYYDCPNCKQTTWLEPRHSEADKSPKQLREKRERDIRLLRQMVENGDTNPRWAYYLGEALEGSEDYRSAHSFYQLCAKTSQWNEEAAWSCYRAACCIVALEDYKQALEACAYGLTKHPAMKELYWLAGWLCAKMGMHHEAIVWSKHALMVTDLVEMSDRLMRRGFRYPYALYEGPYHVLQYAYDELGLYEESAELNDELNRVMKLHATIEAM